MKRLHDRDDCKGDIGGLEFLAGTRHVAWALYIASNRSRDLAVMWMLDSGGLPKPKGRIGLRRWISKNGDILHIAIGFRKKRHVFSHAQP